MRRRDPMVVVEKRLAVRRARVAELLVAAGVLEPTRLESRKRVDTIARIESRIVRRRARVVELRELAKVVIRVARQASTPEAALAPVLETLAALDDGES